MKKFLALFLTLGISSAVNAFVLSKDFETSEGYPELYGSGGSMWLYDHGWSCTSAWYVPYLTMANSDFAHTGARSAEVMAEKSEQRWASYEALWTPSATETTAVYSVSMAFQKYPYGSVGTKCYGGIALRGQKNGSTSEAALGGIQLCVNGTAKTWSYPDGIYASAASNYAYILNTWYQLQMRVDFANHTVQFYLNNEPLGSMSFDPTVVKLSAICLYTGSTDSWSIANARFDTIRLIADEIVFCPSDINHDYCVNLIDFALLASEWMNTDCSLSNGCNGTDLDNSGTVDWGDLAELANHWLNCVEI